MARRVRCPKSFPKLFPPRTCHVHAFRDDVWNCIEQAAPPGSPRPTHRDGMGPLPAALRSTLRHPLNAPDSSRRALILRMSATHSPSPLLPPTPASTCLIAHQAQTCLAVAFSASPSSGSSLLEKRAVPRGRQKTPSPQAGSPNTPTGRRARTDEEHKRHRWSLMSVILDRKQNPRFALICTVSHLGISKYSSPRR